MNDDTISLRGSSYNDSLKVFIPIKYIQLANAKMIERIYLLNIVNQKDSIIILKDNYINTQKNIIFDYHIQLQNNIKSVNDLQKVIDKKNKRIKTLSYTTIGAICITVLAIVL